VLQKTAAGLPCVEVRDPRTSTSESHHQYVYALLPIRFHPFANQRAVPLPLMLQL
jgi:hypothetical protein